MAKNVDRIKAVASRLWSHREKLVWFFIVLGAASFFALPFFAEELSIDEKALMVGSTASLALITNPSAITDRASKLVASKVKGGAHALLSTASSQLSSGGELTDWYPAWEQIQAGGCNISQTVISSEGGDGTEALLLAFPLDAHNGGVDRLSALTAAIAIEAARHLRAARWLAKDILILVLEVNTNQCTALRAMEAWMDSGPDLNTAGSSRVGAIQQGLILEVASLNADQARLGMQGYNGQLPNMDLVALTKRNLEMFTGFSLGLGTGMVWASDVHQPLPYAYRLRAMLSFVYNNVVGRPTGPHAALLQRGIDALTVTLGNSSNVHWRRSGPSGEEMTARHALVIVEMVLRTCNNLHERLHHSSALYVMVGADRFLGIGYYVLPVVALLVALLIQTADALQSEESIRSSREFPPVGDGWMTALLWLAALVVVAGSIQWGTWQQQVYIPESKEYKMTRLGVVAAVIGVSLWISGPRWTAILSQGNNRADGITEILDYSRDTEDSRHRTTTMLVIDPASRAVLCSILLVISFGLLLWRWALCGFLLMLFLPYLQGTKL